MPTTVRASLQGEALTFRNTVRDLTILMALAVFVMYVILAILLRELRASADGAFDAADGARGRIC